MNFVEKKQQGFRPRNLSNSFAKGVFISSVLYIIYLEVGPGLGHIWLRPDSTGTLRLNIQGLGAMLLHAFSSLDFWYPSFWDLNYPLVSLSSGTIAAYYNL